MSNNECPCGGTYGVCAYHPEKPVQFDRAAFEAALKAKIEQSKKEVADGTQFWPPGEGGWAFANGGVARRLTPDLLHEADQRLYELNAEPTTHILCHPGVARRYASLFTCDLAGVYYWKGIPVHRDSMCPPGSITLVVAKPGETPYIRGERIMCANASITGAGRDE